MKGISKWLYTAIVFLIVWVALTGTLRWDELVTGIAVSIILAIFTAHIFTTEGIKNLSPKRVVCGIIYFFPYLIWQMIKANLDVAYRVIHPKRPINPGIVKVKTKMRSNLAKTIVANSITLTPGTFTLDVKGDEMFIHWIDVKTDDVEEASKMIPGVFEKCLMKFMD